MAAKLIPVDRVRETELGDAVSPWTAYKLIKKGELECVRIGRRVYLTPDGIEKFIAKGGAK